MKTFVGTSGFAYKPWKGKFYPARLPDKEMLPFYAERFDTVEINNTFYRMPADPVLARWREQVPEGFSFSIKAPRAITHHARLKQAGDAVAFLFERLESLGERLGPVLFQLPPNLKLDLPRLRDFLATLPGERRVAMEFRHLSWFDDAVFDALREHDAALCIADGELEGEAPFVSTASWGYLRLRAVDYTDEAIGAWAERVREQQWDRGYVFFKHEDEATGPRLAARFIELLNEPGAGVLGHGPGSRSERG